MPVDVEHIGSARLHAGDCLQAMRDMAERGETVHAVVTDPPYHLTSIVKRFGGEAAAPVASNGATGVYGRSAAGFMGKQWDGGDIAFRPETWRLVYDLLPPGGHLVAFGGTRTFHRMAVAIEDAGFDMRDTLMWLYGTGFPKSHDVSKGIEAKMLTGGSGPKNLRQRDMGGAYRPHALAGTEGYGDGRMSRGADTDRDYANAPPVTTPEAAAWAGWGTALKPAWEPIILARKPLAGTVAANVLAHQTGALNIDGCRIACADDYPSGGTHNHEGTGWGMRPVRTQQHQDGRWPANVLHDGSDEVEEAFAAFGSDKGAAAPVRGNEPSDVVKNALSARARVPGIFHGDTGTASRFFYSAKASAADRAGSKHPTVKPVALIRWLVRLVCPVGGTVLDPFAGSGTTGEACRAEGMRAVLCEREPEYQDDIRRRLTRSAAPAAQVDRPAEATPSAARIHASRRASVAQAQTDLFHQAAP